MNFLRNILRAHKNLYHNFIENHKFRKHSLYRHMAIAAFDTSVAFANQYLKNACRFSDRKKLIEYCLQKTQLNQLSTGLYTEFGVYKADSLQIICHYLGPNIPVYGFDSFEGLPENWGTVLAKGAFAVNKLPKAPKNAELIKGWFKDTLPAFIKKHSQPFAFIHIDCDLYQSTKEVLDLIAGQIVPGTIILFDEYINIVDWENHEYRAFKEFVTKQGLSFEYIGYHSEQILGAGSEVAVQILKK